MQDNVKVFNVVLYLVSHTATFKWRTRSVVRAVDRAQLVISRKSQVFIIVLIIQIILRIELG